PPAAIERLLQQRRQDLFRRLAVQVIKEDFGHRGVRIFAALSLMVERHQTAASSEIAWPASSITKSAQPLCDLFGFQAGFAQRHGNFREIPILLLPGMDGTGELLAALADKLAAAHAVQVISYPQNKPLRYDDLTRTVAERTPKDRFVI